MRNKIYIADDEESIKKILVGVIDRFFSQYRDKMDLFDNGESLYEKLISNGEDVRLVLTDNNMPKMNGLEVIKKCALLYPEIHFIQMSGFDIREDALDAGARDFIEKPFSISTLKSTLEKYL